MSDISFEEMSDKFLDGALELYNYYIHNSTATFHKHTFSVPEMKGLILFRDKRYRTFAVLDDGTFGGYVTLCPFDIREAYDSTAEVTVYLDSAHISQGIGGRSLRYIEKFAQAGGFHALVARVCGENSKSLRLFEKNGYLKCAAYKEVGEKFGRKLDLVCFEKII